MAHIRIEIDRGYGWQIRQEGDLDMPVAEMIATLPAYTIQYPHRLFVDGALVASSSVTRAGGKVTVVRHDAV